jgi:hypothetical protein
LTLDAKITSEGEKFTVSLLPSMGDGSSGSGSGTFFNVVDANQDEVSAVVFTSASGTVTITTAVPEPPSMICGLASVVLLAARLCHGRITHKKKRRREIKGT